MTKSRNGHLSDVPAQAAYAAMVLQAAGGNSDAMERLLVHAQEVAYRFSLLVCGHPEDAEDVMQDALLKTYRHVRRIKKPEAFRTWLYQIVRNACLMKRRRRVGEPAHFVSLDRASGDRSNEPPIEVEDPAPRADQQLVDTWINDRLKRALAALPPSYRVIVVLREIEGLSTREAAKVLGISEVNVKTRLHRAHGMMRRQLEGM